MTASSRGSSMPRIHSLSLWEIAGRVGYLAMLFEVSKPIDLDPYFGCGHAFRGRALSPHGPNSRERHATRTRAAVRIASDGLSVSRLCEESAWKAGYRVPIAPRSDLRARVFLASSFVRVCLQPENKAGFLAAKIPPKHRTRWRLHQAARGGRLESAGGVGM